MKWTDGRKLVWNCIECTHIHDPKAKATPAQVKSEVWMALIHGSRGLIYFVHQFAPKFNEHALLDDPEMLAAVTAINRQIRELAPVLNSPTVPDGATVRSSDAEVPIDLMVKKMPEAVYVFAVGMRNKPARGSFTRPRPPRRRRRPACSAKTGRSRSGMGSSPTISRPTASTCTGSPRAVVPRPARGRPSAPRLRSSPFDRGRL